MILASNHDWFNPAIGAWARRLSRGKANDPKTRDFNPAFDDENPARSQIIHSPSAPLLPTCIRAMVSPNPTVAGGSTSDAGSSPQPSNYPEIEIDVPPPHTARGVVKLTPV
jgi:hypothetical protein